jgi:hypothetical protein
MAHTITLSAAISAFDAHNGTPTPTVYTATLNLEAALKAENAAFRTWNAATDTASSMAESAHGPFALGVHELRKLAMSLLNCAMLKVEALDAGDKLSDAMNTRRTAQLVFTAAQAIVNAWDSESRHGAAHDAQWHALRVETACEYLTRSQIGEAFTLAEGYCPKA